MSKLFTRQTFMALAPLYERQRESSGSKFQVSSDFRASGEKKLKRCFDVAIVFSLGLILSPFILLMIVILLVAQGRPVFFRHKRLGLGGEKFDCYKFRTMVVNGDDIWRRHIAENQAARQEWEEKRKLKDDPRVTTLGRVLRKTSVDELPQLFNVLRGDMSLVGPRPIVESEVESYGPAIRQYYRVRPGLTGLWQISGRSDVSFASRVSMDLTYFETANFVNDMSILVKTVPAVLKSKGSC